MEKLEAGKAVEDGTKGIDGCCIVEKETRAQSRNKAGR